MSLLHRSLLAAAASQALKQAEPFLIDALETAVSIAVPAAAPVANLVLGMADAAIRANNPDIPAPGATTPDHVAAAISQLVTGAAPAPAPVVAPVATLSPAPYSPPLPAVNDANTAALAALNAITLQLSQLATVVAAMQSQLTPANLTAAPR